jgi:hypothetical protein
MIVGLFKMIIMVCVVKGIVCLQLNTFSDNMNLRIE